MLTSGQSITYRTSVRLTTGVSSSSSSPPHFDLTTGFFTAGGGGGGADAALVGAGLVGLAFAGGSWSEDSSIFPQKKNLS